MHWKHICVVMVDQHWSWSIKVGQMSDDTISWHVTTKWLIKFDQLWSAIIAQISFQCTKQENINYYTSYNPVDHWLCILEKEEEE